FVGEAVIAEVRAWLGMWVWRRCGVGFYPCHRSLQILGVDSAEADKVGSLGFRFCAFGVGALYQGVRHRRATSARLVCPSVLVFVMCVVLVSDSHLITDCPVSVIELRF